MVSDLIGSALKKISSNYSYEFIFLNSKDGRLYIYITFNNDLYIMLYQKIVIKDKCICITKNEICQLYIKNYDVKNIKQKKNWTPYVYKNELYFIYSFCELCVVKLKNGTTGNES